MYRSYQPLKPVTSRYLQQRWDQNNYIHHRREVTSALPVVDNRGIRTPTHIQLKLKKLQLQDERLAIIDRDNRLLASKLANIMSSKGLVDHRNQYHLKSLNADERREELLLVSRQNQAIYERMASRQSEYRHQLWLDDWQRAEHRRDRISRYPRGLAEKQRSARKVKFAGMEGSDGSRSCSNTSSDRTIRNTSSDRTIRNTSSDRTIRNTSSDRTIRNTSSDRTIRNTSSDRTIRNTSSDRTIRNTSSDRTIRNTYSDRTIRNTSSDRTIRNTYSRPPH